MWFDSHCHLDFPAFDADRRAVWDRARQRGVRDVFVPGYSPAQWSRLARLTEDIAACVGVGVHPYALGELDEAWQDAVASIEHWCGVVSARAIGECGLDRRKHQKGEAPMASQVQVLQAHIELSKRLGLPLVLHVVGEHGRALELLEASGALPGGGVVHSYSGSAELVVRYLRLGFSFGFGANACRSGARKVRAALCAVPLDRLLLETDAPDQLPAQFDALVAGRNEPAALPDIAAQVAGVLSLPVPQLASITTENARRLFGV